MTSIVLIILNILLILSECSMISCIGAKLFPLRCGTWPFWAGAIIMAVANCAAIQAFSNNTVLRIFVSLILFTVWMMLSFRISLPKCIFTVAILLSFWNIADNLFVMAAIYLLGGDIGFLSENPFVYYSLAYSAKLFEFLGILLAVRFWKKELRATSAAWADWLRTLFFPLTTLLISLILTHILFRVPEFAVELLICTIILLLADMMSIFLLDFLEKQRIAIQDRAILQQSLKKEQESIQAWVAAYQAERKRSHDFQNQLTVLKGMAANNVPREELLKFLDSLLNIQLPTTRYIDTHRPVADVLISQKAEIAKSKGILFRMQLDDLSQFPLADDALVVVLANLLDNAIEACEKIEDVSKRWIVLKMQVRPTVSYLQVENTTAFPVRSQNNKIHTTKADPQAHGFGLQNVETLLAQANAMYLLDYRDEDHVFFFFAQIAS